MSIKNVIRAHEDAYFSCLNLVASENRLSPDVTSATASDLGARYCIPPAHERPPAIWDYPNQHAPREVDRLAREIAMELFGGRYADCRPLSGNNAAGIVLKALVKPGGLVLAVPADCGGHFATEVICQDIGCELMFLAYDRTRGCIDVEASKRATKGRHPDLIFLDASAILFPHPVQDLRDAFGPNVPIAYDASHVMGLIGGGQFQDPLREGADLIQGSTHKTLFGPQKALIVCKDMDSVTERITSGVVPLFVSNAHVHHIAALGIALEEMRDYGADYAREVVKNASALAYGLNDEGCSPILGNHGFTRSHQVILPIGTRKEAEVAFFSLESTGLHTNCIRVPFADDEFGLRIGTAELTRRGFGENEMREIARLFVDVIRERRTILKVRQDVASLSGAFRGIFFWNGADDSHARRHIFDVTQGERDHALA